MKGTYIGIGIVTVVVVVAVVFGFIAMGSPWAVRGYKFDATRISDFSSIQEAAQEYYNDNRQLPASLSVLASSTEGSYYVTEGIFNDPDTKQPYSYKLVDQSHYQLCATFSADSSEEAQYDQSEPYDYIDAPEGAGSPSGQHTKGYDCLSYSVPVAQNDGPIYPPTHQPVPTSGIENAASGTGFATPSSTY